MDEKLQQECICPMCPSYVKCGEPLAYCLPGVSISQCIKSELGCICPGCPVQEKMGYTKDYYCLRKD
jgi:hypothetical protein